MVKKFPWNEWKSNSAVFSFFKNGKVEIVLWQISFPRVKVNFSGTYLSSLARMTSIADEKMFHHGRGYFRHLSVSVTNRKRDRFLYGTSTLPRSYQHLHLCNLIIFLKYYIHIFFPHIKVLLMKIIFIIRIMNRNDINLLRSR